MKNLKRNVLLLVLTLSTTTMMNSCAWLDVNYDQLTGFMLGGIYFIDGYGGMDEMVAMLEDDEETDNEDLLIDYEYFLVFPFDDTQQTDCADYLNQYWDITDKVTLLLQMEELKSREHEHKAWDYARMVNIAAQGYAAQYLTREEVLEKIAEILPLAREKYVTWEAYYADYNAGLKVWDPESEQVVSFGEVTKDILSHEKSCYKLLPLNP